jgi:hypothetical protein
MKTRIFLSVLFDPLWSYRNWHVIKREWRMERL